MIFPTLLTTTAFSDMGRVARGYFDIGFDLEASFDYSIYVSTKAGFATLPSDTLRSQPFRPAFKNFRFTRSILGSRLGEASAGKGRLGIHNGDGFYDFLTRGYSIDARPIIIRATRAGHSYDEAMVIANVTSNGWLINGDEVDVDLIDLSYKLNVPMQINSYLGTGGREGGTDLQNKKKPLVFGPAREVSPPLVDAALEIYQVNDGSIESVVGVYDKGVALAFVGDYPTYEAMAAANLSALDGYVTCLAEGYIRLTDTPENLTCDVEGDNRDGYVETTADIVRWAIRNRTTVADPEELEASSFDVVNEDQPATIDYWLGPDDTITVADFAANLMGGIYGWIHFKRDGHLEARIFGPAAGVPVARFSRRDMIGDDFRREELPSAYRPSPWRWLVPWARAWTVQSELSTDVTDERRAFLAADVRLAKAESAAIKVDHPLATDPDPIQAYFSNEPDAGALAERLLSLFRVPSAIYRMTLPRRALRLNLGDTIEVTHDRFELGFGRLMTVVEMSDVVSLDTGQIDMVEVAAHG
jgi:hypothetical protein